MNFLRILGGLIMQNTSALHKSVKLGNWRFYAYLLFIIPPLLVAGKIFLRFWGYLPTFVIFIPFLPFLYLLSFVFFANVVSQKLFNNKINFWSFLPLLLGVQITEFIRNFLIFFTLGNFEFNLSFWHNFLFLLTVLISLFYAHFFLTREFSLSDQDGLVTIALAALFVSVVRFIFEKIIFTGLLVKVFPFL